MSVNYGILFDLFVIFFVFFYFQGVIYALYLSFNI